MCLLGRQWFFDKYHVFLRQLNLVKLDSFVAGGWLQAKCWCQVKALLKAKWVYSDSIFLDQRKTLEDLIIHIGFSGFFPCHPPLWTPVRILPQGLKLKTTIFIKNRFLCHLIHTLLHSQWLLFCQEYYLKKSWYRGQNPDKFLALW